MHVMISWDIVNHPQPLWDNWNERLKEVIRPYAWVRPLGTVYVVPIQSEIDRQAIINGMTAVSNQSGGSIHVLISPAMIGGQYAGVLPQNLWPELNSRSI